MSYLNYDEIVTAIRLLAESYSKHCSLVLLPNYSVETRPIYALEIGDNRGPSVRTAIYVGGVHAREWIPPDALIYFCADLLEARSLGTGLTYGKARIPAEEIHQIFSYLQLLVLPCANPDGRIYSQQVDRMWRKNRAPFATPNGGICFGVDLNRNFDVAWDFKRIFAPDAARASHNPCNKQIYVGPTAASEPETRNIVWMLDRYIGTRWYLDIHSHFPAILHCWSIDEHQTDTPEMNYRNHTYDGRRGSRDGPAYREYLDPSDLREFRRLGYLMADEIQRVRGDVYQVGSSLSLCPPLYASPGTSKDYAYGRHLVDPYKPKVFAFTVECGHAFQPAWNEAENVIREVSAALARFAVAASSTSDSPSLRPADSTSDRDSADVPSHPTTQKETSSMKTHWIINNGPPGGFRWQGRSEPDTDSSHGLEVIIDEPNFKALWWLRKAIEVSSSVARVKFANGSATGFLIAPDIFMTNNHVIEDEHDASSARLQFNYQLKEDGTLATVDEWRCDPTDLFHTNPDLDYTIVRVAPIDNKRAGDSWGFLDLRHGATVSVGQRVNIIQHPQGRFKEIAFRDNQVMAANSDEPFIQYLTDTDYGTSGSPVFDDWFNVVALHSRRVRDPRDPQRWYRNQGFRIEAILGDAGSAIP